MSVYHMNAWFLQRPEKGVGSLELELTVSHHMGAGNKLQP